MAYIAQRGAYWRAEVRRKGYKPTYRTFDTKLQAQQWARQVESSMDAGLYTDRTEAERTTLREALERYRREIVPAKRYPTQENGRIQRWLKTDLAYRSLASLRGADFAKYRDGRRGEGKAENTIRLELQLVSHLFEMARKEWGLESLPNPLKNIRKPGGSSARDRRLADGEYDAIKAQLESSANRYAAPAFDLAIETALRKGSLFSLRWEWVDLPARMIRFPAEARRAANKGVPAVLPLSTRAHNVLAALRAEPLEESGAASEVARVLPTTPNAVMLVWTRTLARLQIDDLRWHDLRHEAVSRLFEKGFHPMQVASISGHRSMQMLARYTHLRPEDLLDRLG
ncbi:Phage integrase family protein [Cupriavidus sp. YR651]|uniref:tyrosine-type recombinase/integrase n=1 Tax=Cupriavidus sp. YR651 TaxID=1855315 RepID=UPI00088CA228|nr:site-specific integrase [Cupriavidus sp. YR651]SDC19974.1 Phage integrase family protein [Cupriavidus sp. YR651]